MLSLGVLFISCSVRVCLALMLSTQHHREENQFNFQHEMLWFVYNFFSILGANRILNWSGLCAMWQRIHRGYMHHCGCLFHEFEKFWLSSQHPRHCSKVRNFAGGFPSKTNLTFSWRARSQPPLWNAIGFDFWISKFEPVALERDGCGQRSATSRQIFVVMRYWVHEGSSVLIPKKCFRSFFCLFMQKKCINVDRSLWKQHCYRHSEFWTIVFMSKHYKCLWWKYRFPFGVAFFCVSLVHNLSSGVQPFSSAPKWAMQCFTVDIQESCSGYVVLWAPWQEWLDHRSSMLWHPR